MVNFAPYMRVLPLALASLPLSWALKGDAVCVSSVCVTATVEGDDVHYELTPMVPHTGWVALGFGFRMVPTHSVIMWKNGDGSTTLSQRYTDSYRMPQPVQDPPRKAVTSEPKKYVTYPSYTTTFAFHIPANKTLLQSSDPREPLVFAYSEAGPGSSDPDAPIPRHQIAGHLTFDLTKEFVDPTKPKKPNTPGKIEPGVNAPYKRVEKFIILHGFLVSLGFLVLLPAGSLIGRWGRVFTPLWFRAHWISNMVLAMPAITLGVLLGPVIVYSKESFRIHFANAHEICGMILLFIYYAQVLLGRYIHNRRMRVAKLGPITQPHPPLNIVHICLGVSIIGLSLFQVRSGLEWWETLTNRGPISPWAWPLWTAWTVILPVAYFTGYILLPRQLRQEREAAYAPIPAATLEARSQASHLLAEEEEEFDQNTTRVDPTKSSMEAPRNGNGASV
ncbi:unnamed protein product [Cyclocybe aegerita]|uniref:DOMON domain-containing protein n=1 Tax=Cyclocybe aegerita TaxID=1973307 RepID=A0A8S0WPQ3_CYCAE|nr:unnamed protein product [Cyclocybe aegerita]